MKKRTIYTSLAVITALLAITSCKNDLDVLAPGEESVSVYGVLNPNEQIQNIRINKVYITDGDVLAAGQEADKINYGPGELKVSLERYMTGSTTPTLTTVGDGSKKEIVLTETVVTTASGNFNTSQRIWQTTDRLFKTGEYKLIIKNLTTGKEFSAQNLVVDSVKTFTNPLTRPFVYNPAAPSQYPMHGSYVYAGGTVAATPDAEYIDYTNFSADQRIRFKTVPNALLYNVTMRFHFVEYYTTGDSSYQYVDMNFPTVKAANLNGTDIKEVTFATADFYNNLANTLSKRSVSNLAYRRTNYMEYSIYAGAESLDEFLQINAPSNSIAQDKPNYTNIKGGVGIFSAKSKTVVTKDLLTAFIDKIACYSVTNPHKFRNYSGNLVPPCN